MADCPTDLSIQHFKSTTDNDDCRVRSMVELVINNIYGVDMAIN